MSSKGLGKFRGFRIHCTQLRATTGQQPSPYSREHVDHRRVGGVTFLEAHEATTSGRIGVVGFNDANRPLPDVSAHHRFVTSLIDPRSLVVTVPGAERRRTDGPRSAPFVPDSLEAIAEWLQQVTRPRESSGWFTYAAASERELGYGLTVTSTCTVLQQHWSPPPPLPEMSLPIAINR